MNRSTPLPSLPRIHRLCTLGLRIQLEHDFSSECDVTAGYPDAVEEFIDEASHKTWSDFEYDPEAAGQAIADPAFVARASLEQLRTLLTYFVRGERFCDGHWTALIADGTLDRLIQRLRQLLPRFEFSALKYLNMWLAGEQTWVQAMREGIREKKLGAMAQFAAAYRISRNLHRKYESIDGKQTDRFAPVLDIIDKLRSSQFEGDQLRATTQDIAHAVSARYGGRGVLSATTKFLWLKLQHPIVIYDRQARVALGLKSQDLGEYLTRWRQAYDAQKSYVEAACRKLPDVCDFWAIPDALTENDVEGVIHSPWFRERVFDIYLWTIGASV